MLAYISPKEIRTHLCYTPKFGNDFTVAINDFSLQVQANTPATFGIVANPTFVKKRQRIPKLSIGVCCRENASHFGR